MFFATRTAKCSRGEIVSDGQFPKFKMLVKDFVLVGLNLERLQPWSLLNPVLL